MSCLVTRIRNAVSEERITFIIRLERISELGTNKQTKQKLATEALCEEPLTTSLTRATRCHIPEDGFIHSHSREYLKSYIALTGWALTDT
jgi:hypothetical protein